MIVDAGPWLYERSVLLKPEWVEGISWDERHVAVKLTRETVKTSPLFCRCFHLFGIHRATHGALSPDWIVHKGTFTMLKRQHKLLLDTSCWASSGR